MKSDADKLRKYVHENNIILLTDVLVDNTSFMFDNTYLFDRSLAALPKNRWYYGTYLRLNPVKTACVFIKRDNTVFTGVISLDEYYRDVKRKIQSGEYSHYEIINYITFLSI